MSRCYTAPKANRRRKIFYFVLTGVPGVGKTTLIKKLIPLINEIGVNTTGFYTEEVRKGRFRLGFDVVALDGTRARLARHHAFLEAPPEKNVGKYGVFIDDFEKVAMASLKDVEKTQEPDTTTCLVIDEIGKMEFFSEPFKDRIKEITAPKSERLLLAAIPVKKNDPPIEAIKNNRKAKIWTVTTENRDTVHEEIINELKHTVSAN